MTHASLKSMVSLGFTILEMLNGEIFTFSELQSNFSGSDIVLLTTPAYGRLSTNTLLNLGFTEQTIIDAEIPFWEQLGDNIFGSKSFDFSADTFQSISLSSDGTMVAVGAQHNDNNGNSSGNVRVFNYVSDVEGEAGNWVQVGPSIDGARAYDYSGYSISISSN